MTEQNLATMFFARVRRHGDRTCMLVKREGQWVELSWNRVGEDVRQLTRGLQALGMQPGDKAALLSENRPEWMIADLATLAAGGVLATIYASSNSEQIQYIVDHSDARFLFVSGQDQLQKVLEIAAQMPKVAAIIAFDRVEPAGETRVMALADVLALGRSAETPEEFDQRLLEIGSDSPATLIYTSGTTGPPKGVQLSHHNILSNVETSTPLLHVLENDIALSFLPLSHVFELTVGHLAAIYTGCRIAYAESINALPDNLLEIQPTLLASVPRIYEKVHDRIIALVEQGPALRKRIFHWAMRVGRKRLDYTMQKRRAPWLLQLQHRLADRLVFAKIRGRFGGRLRFCASAGAPIALELLEFFHTVGIIILEGYGLTETSPIITVNTPDHCRLGTVGRAIPGVEVKIAPDGEILCRGPNVMMGYYKNATDTAEVMEGGWFHTGDIGVIDADGYLTITDRKKDLIVTSGGKNISPQNIESVLRMEKYVDQVNVIGDRRKYLTAVIVPNFQDLEKFAEKNRIAYKSMSDLVEHPVVRNLIEQAVKRANRTLARYETIKNFIISDVAFTEENDMLTPTNKIKRKIVEKYFANRIDRLYEV